MLLAWQLNQLNQAAPGSTTQIVTMSQLQPNAESIPFVDTTELSVSTDDGQTWLPATSVDNLFAVITNPTTPGFVSLKVTQHLNDGGTVTETIIRAYRVATS